MNRFAGVVLALALLTPAVAEAQTRPSNTMHTNSAALYLDRARRSNRDEEKKELLDKALTFALDAIKAKADNPRAYLLAGQVYVQQGNATAADSMFDKAEQLWPDYAKETENERMQVWVRAYNAGVLAMRAQNYAEALKQFEQADAVYAKRPGARLNLAQLYARNREFDKAVTAYRGALEILRGNQQGLKPEEQAEWKELEEIATFNLAALLATQNKNDEAVTLYQELLKRDPNNAVAKGNLAAALSRLGKNDEAAKMYSELLSQDLSDTEFFNVGVGLFKANQFEPAAEAFRKAVTKNPHMRDAHYNLAQAVYSHAQALETQKQNTPAEAKAIDARLAPLFTELSTITEKLRAIDPANRNVIALQARSYRALADLAADATKATEWKNKTLEVLKVNEALTFEVSDVSMSAVAEEVQIAGSVVNLKGTAGQSVKLRFTLLGASGQALGTQEVTVALPETQAATPFKAAFQTKETVAGWKYEVL